MGTHATAIFLVSTLIMQFLIQFITCPDGNCFYLFLLIPDAILHLKKGLSFYSFSPHNVDLLNSMIQICAYHRFCKLLEGNNCIGKIPNKLIFSI